MDPRRHHLELDAQRQAALIAAARDAEPVRGLTHGFYKYPARFSPAFARTAIETFTRPGQLVLDPYVGGGTSLVEALASGRKAIGVDISPLAEFVTRVKCTIFSEAELEMLERWSMRLCSVVDVHASSMRFIDYAELGYYKHLDHPSRWRLRKAIEQALLSAIRLGEPRLEAFGRCAVLRTAQWALDGRRKLPNIEEFRTSLGQIAAQMVQGARELRTAVIENGQYPVSVIHRGARYWSGPSENDRSRQWRPRPAIDLNRDLSKRYGLPVEIDSKLERLAGIGHALDRGDLVYAMMATLHLEFPDPPEPTRSGPGHRGAVDLSRSLKASGLLKADWDPRKHPRWPAGSANGIGGEFAPAGTTDSASGPAELQSAPAQVIPVRFDIPDGIAFTPANATALPLPRLIPGQIPFPSEIVPPPALPPNVNPITIPRNPYPGRPKMREGVGSGDRRLPGVMIERVIGNR